ncbi:hypothetical protein MSG28_015457 [Choristoneura fumiferana]|uniref:Uncharacterized protein n=1 Tax=Choristoneura fumiferana TaxID=7141 RepID=A0ACC0KA89_CHOFU|nr:hypothetical protein MSG28_015457 [Choristoneura fumiferana]
MSEDVRSCKVWFPDSAYKTSQAINDFSREGLPIIIFANWRGFSGGQKVLGAAHEQQQVVARAARGADIPT